MSTPVSDDNGLFMQLLVFTDCSDIKPLLFSLQHLSIDCLVYEDLNDPQGIGLLAVADDPELLVSDLRDTLRSRVFRVLMQRHELTMIGRTCRQTSPPREQLEDVVKKADWPWAVWYPMRGTVAFSNLDETAQIAVLDDIAGVTDLDADEFGHTRLKSHGLDRNGNEFVHGIHARSLHELSRHVEATKRAQLHSEHIADTGPFFVGRALGRGIASTSTKARW